MKLRRPLLIGIAAVAAILLLVIAIAFSSGFQTWAARKALASQPGMKGSVGQVSARLKRVAVKDLRIERDGVVFTAPAIDAELPLLSAGVSRKINVTKLVARGWVLDLRRASGIAPKPVAGKPAPQPREFSLLPSAYAADPSAPAVREIFQGIFAQLQLPVDLSLDGVELEGEIILPLALNRAASRMKTVVRGGGLAAGREGKFSFDLTMASSAGVAPVSAVALHGTFAAAMDTPRSFTKLALKSEASASGTQFPRGVKLNTDITAAREAGAESYVLLLAGETRQLASVNARLPQAVGGAPAKLAGTWKLDLGDADLTPFLFGIDLPKFSVSGGGGFEADPAIGEIHSSGKLNATAENLAALRPELAAIGVVRVVADFDVAQRGEVIRVEHFNADFSSEKPVANVKALQAFECNLATVELKIADPAKELLGVVLRGVPLAWAQPFVQDMTLSGGDLTGEFAVSARGGLALRSKTPLVITGLALEQGGKPLIKEVNVSVASSADYTPQGWQVELSPVTAKSGDGTLATLEAKAGQLVGRGQPIKATGRLALNLPAVLAQPVAAGAAQLTTGDATIDFAATIGAKQELQAKVALANLAAGPKESPEKLPAIAMDLRADREADGKITLNAPLLVERDGRKSDLNITGTLAPEKTGFNLDAHLASGLLVVDDVKILAAPFAGSGAAAPSKPDQNPPRDTAPPWAGLNGKVTLALKKLVYSDTFQMSDVAGTLRLEGGGAKIEDLRAGIGEEGELKMSGGVTFDGKARDPYTLKADLAVTDVDSVPLFRALDPTRTPTVEGKFNVASQLAGTGANLADLGNRAQGDLQLMSKGGIFRLLDSDMAEAIKSAPSTLSGIVTGIGSLIGREESAEKLALEINKKGKLVTELGAALDDIKYDQLSVVVVRDDARNINLKDFTLIAPEVRLNGSGQIAYQDKVSLLAQALDLRVQIAARGTVGDLMRRLNLLSGAEDNLGYAAFVSPIHIGGTLSNPDRSQLKSILLKVASATLLDSLKGK
jgi:hypothetical protein